MDYSTQPRGKLGRWVRVRWHWRISDEKKRRIKIHFIYWTILISLVSWGFVTLTVKTHIEKFDELVAMSEEYQASQDELSILREQAKKVIGQSQ